MNEPGVGLHLPRENRLNFASADSMRSGVSSGLPKDGTMKQIQATLTAPMGCNVDESMDTLKLGR